MKLLSIYWFKGDFIILLVFVYIHLFWIDKEYTIMNNS